jgi:hypothetical protein
MNSFNSFANVCTNQNIVINKRTSQEIEDLSNSRINNKNEIQK